jgi:hypothetical protein
MKKQIFIIPFIACMLAMFNVKAQNTPIDDFLKKYPSKEGVTTVTMSQQMLQSIFAPPDNSKVNEVTLIGNPSVETSLSSSKISYSANEIKMNYFTSLQNLNVPEAYSSMSAKRDIPENLSADWIKNILFSKYRYEKYMEINNENSIELGYFVKKLNDSINEIVVIRQQKDQISAIYIKGNIKIDQVDRYLSRIKSALTRMGATNQTNMFPSGSQFAFVPSFDNIQFPNFKEFNFKSDSTYIFKMDEDFKLRLEESMKDMKEKMKDLYQNENFQRNIENVMENVQKRIEDAQRQMEEKIKQTEKEQDMGL